MKPIRLYSAFLVYFALLTSTAAIPLAAAENVRGIVKPLAEVELATEISARISRMPYRDGERFEAGDILIEFGCDRQHAELSVVRAARTATRQTHESNLELVAHDAVGKHEVLQSRAELDRVIGQVKAQLAVVSECVVAAPFNGRILKNYVNAFESPSPGSPLMKIVDDSDFELELIVPSAWLSWLRPEQEFQFSVDETGETYPAFVKQIGAAVDPVSQTVMLTARFAVRPEWVLSGMSGTAEFKPLQLGGALRGN